MTDTEPPADPLDPTTEPQADELDLETIADLDAEDGDQVGGAAYRGCSAPIP